MNMRCRGWTVRWLAALAAILIFPQAQAGLFDPTSYMLDNGMQVVVIEDQRAPVVTHMIWFRAGAADETPGKSGLAHFLEHLMFKGTKKYPGGEFSKIIARNGGQENAFTSQDLTGYYQNLSADKLALVMEMFADLMANLQLDEGDIRTERQVILEERSQRVDNNPAAQFGEQLRAALYLSHPYGKPVVGWKHEMEKLSLADALGWYRRYYAPNNAILIVAGAVRAEDVKRLAERYYGPLSKADLPVRARAIEPPHRAPRRLTFTDPRVRLPSMRRSYLAPSARGGVTKHARALSVLDQILGGGATSRLYRILVVEKKLALSAGSGFSGLSLDQNSFTFYVSPRPEVSLEKVEAALDEIIADVLRDGVTLKELKQGKFALRAQSVYARDNLFSGPRILGRALSIGLSIADVESWPERVAKVTREEVLAAARHVFRLERSVTGYLKPSPKPLEKTAPKAATAKGDKK